MAKTKSLCLSCPKTNSIDAKNRGHKMLSCGIPDEVVDLPVVYDTDSECRIPSSTGSVGFLLAKSSL